VALKNIIGVDHAVVMVGDLDKAAANWERLGFTVSPRGAHSAKMGSGNYTIMLDPDYIELLGVLTEKRLKQVLVVSPKPAKDAALLARMIDRDAKDEPDAAVAVPSGSDRADFIFLTKEQLARRFPGVSLAGLPERGGCGLVLATSDPASTEKTLGSAAARSGGAICVTPAVANGTLLAFVEA
jgi:hypothetical protein